MSIELKLELWASRELSLPNDYRVELDAKGFTVVKHHGQPIDVAGISGKKSDELTEHDLQTLLHLATSDTSPKSPSSDSRGIDDK